MEKNSAQNLQRSFKGIWIPKEIWLDRRLSYFEKCLLAEIHSLDDEERGCFASNEYFVEFFNERERKIQEGLSKLKSLGYIAYEKFDGRIRTLRSNIYGDKTLFSTSGVSKSAPPTCGIPHPSSIGEPIEADNIYDNIKEKGSASPPPPLPSPPSVAQEVSPAKKPGKRKKVKEEFKKRAERVFTTDSQHQTLLEEAKGDESLVNKWYKRLSKWKIDSRTMGGDRDSQAITSWVIRAVAENPEKEQIRYQQAPGREPTQEEIDQCNEPNVITQFLELKKQYPKADTQELVSLIQSSAQKMP